MKHNHHTTPRYYLKGFRIPSEPPYIWQYQRGKPYNPGHRADHHNPVKRPLKTAGVIKDYYGAYEDQLAKREEQATPLIERLRTSNTSTTPLLNHHEKEQLTDYIGLLIKRTTAREARLPGIWKNVMDRERPRLIELIALRLTLADQGRFSEALQISAALAPYEQGMPADLMQQTILRPFERVSERIPNLYWTIAIAPPHHHYITSDNPVRFPHEGINDTHAFLTLPLSTSVSLIAAAAPALNLPRAEQDCTTIQAAPEQVDTLNHLTITGAHHYLYSHEANEHLAQSFG